MWVLPNHCMAFAGQALGPNCVTVAEKHWVAIAIGFDAHAPATEHIRSIRVEGDAAKALCLALTCEHAATGVKAFE